MNYKNFEVIYKTALGKKKVAYVTGRDRKEAKSNFNRNFSIQEILSIEEIEEN